MKFVIHILLFLLLISCSKNINEEFESIENFSPSSTENIETINSNFKIGNNFSNPFEHTFFSFELCEDLLSSDTKVSCVGGTKIIESIEFEAGITSIEIVEDNLFLTLKSGYLVKYDPETKTKNVVLDISDKVITESIEMGLLSFDINDLDENFVISYVDKENFLNFEKFVFKNQIENIQSSEVLLKIKNESNIHYSGKVFWSDKFQCYLVSVGDMHFANFESRINPKPLDTSKLEGKIFGLDCNNIFSNKVKITPNGENQIENLIAFGLRSPWQFLIFEDFLIVFDTGFSQNEELNIVKLNEYPIFFGWPVFEGTKRSEDLDSIENYESYFNLSIWENDTINELFDYVYSFQESPVFYYNHFACENDENKNCDSVSNVYRAAIIGGDILNNALSEYNFDIFFADHLSQELFSFNLIERNLKIFPLNDFMNINIVKVFDDNKNIIMAGTNDGKLYFVKLP